MPPPPADLPELSVDEIARLTGDAARGKNTAHALPDVPRDRRHRRGAWPGARRLGTRQVCRRDRDGASSARARRSRTATRASELKTKDGVTIQGVLIKEGDPLMMRSMGGITQIIPADRVASRRRMPGSLMMSAAQLGLTAQDVADLVAFLRAN